MLLHRAYKHLRNIPINKHLSQKYFGLEKVYLKMKNIWSSLELHSSNHHQKKRPYFLMVGESNRHREWWPNSVYWWVLSIESVLLLIITYKKAPNSYVKARKNLVNHLLRNENKTTRKFIQCLYLRKYFLFGFITVPLIEIQEISHMICLYADDSFLCHFTSCLPST